MRKLRQVSRGPETTPCAGVRPRYLPVMFTLADVRVPLVTGSVLAAAGMSGLLLARATPMGMLLVAALAFAAVAVVTFEAPLVALSGIGLLLGIVSEEARDNRLLGLSGFVYEPVVFVLDPAVIVLGLLAVVLALTLPPGSPIWPGAPATAAVVLFCIALVYALWFGPLGENLSVIRPTAVLVLAIAVGYWVTLRYGVDVPLKVIIYAAALAIPVGFYNVASGDLSYYDSSVVYLLGIAALLVLFRAVDIGFARIPFIALSALVIVLSLRRGAMLGLVVALVIVGIVAVRGTVGRIMVVAAAAVVAAELLAPGIVLSPVEDTLTYFTGGSGRDFNVNYRKYETENAWLNVERNWLWGIGPNADWTLYRSFDGKFEVQDPRYVHNSYLWVWLRYGLFGLAALACFLAISALTLIRRSAPIVSVTAGAAVVGLAGTLVTASFLTTTTRWPLTIGLLVGIGLAAMRLEHAQAEGTAVAPTPADARTVADPVGS